MAVWPIVLTLVVGLILALAAVSLAACFGAAPPVPRDHFYRIVAPTPAQVEAHIAYKGIMAVNRLAARLSNRGFNTVALSGELSQSERTHALQAMRDGRAQVCVATDVAARGIDLPNLDLVIHADLPTGKAALLHRSGRTGRAGRKGTCVLMVPFPRRRQAERVPLVGQLRSSTRRGLVTGALIGLIAALLLDPASV